MVLQQRDHAVKGEFGLVTQHGFVKVVEDVFDNLRLKHRSHDKVDVVLGIFLSSIAHELLAGIEVAVGTGHHGILDTALQVKAERSVGLGGCLLVAAVVAHDADDRVGYRFIILVHHIARNPYLQIRLDKLEDVVIAAGIATVAGEETALSLAKGDAKVIG